MPLTQDDIAVSIVDLNDSTVQVPVVSGSFVSSSQLGFLAMAQGDASEAQFLNIDISGSLRTANPLDIVEVISFTSQSQELVVDFSNVADYKTGMLQLSGGNFSGVVTVYGSVDNGTTFDPLHVIPVSFNTLPAGVGNVDSEGLYYFNVAGFSQTKIVATTLDVSASTDVTVRIAQGASNLVKLLSEGQSGDIPTNFVAIGGVLGGTIHPVNLTGNGALWVQNAEDHILQTTFSNVGDDLLFDGTPTLYSTAWIAISGTWSGTITFQEHFGSFFGPTVIGDEPIPALNVRTGVLSGSTTTNGLYLVNITGLAGFTIIASAWNSGTAVIELRASVAPSAMGLVTPLPTGNNTIGAINLQDGSGNAVASATSSPSGTERGLIVRNIPSGTQTITGSVSLSQTATVTGSVGISGIPTVTGSMTVPNTVTVTGSLKLSETATITGSVGISGTPTVTGSLSVLNTVTVKGLQLGGTGSTAPTTASLAGLVDNAGTLRPFLGDNSGRLMVQVFNTASVNVNGTATITGSVALSQIATVTGSMTVPNTVTVTGSLKLSETATVTGSVALSQTATVTGSITVPNTVTITDISIVGTGSTAPLSGVLVGGKDSNGNFQPLSQDTSRNLLVTGSITVPNTVTVTGSLKLSETATVTGSLKLSEIATVTGSITVPNTVTVTGSLKLSEIATVTGSMTVPNTVTITGSVGITQQNASGSVRVSMYPNIDQVTYSAVAESFAAATSATDIFAISGSSTKTVRVTRMEIYATQTTAGGNLTIRLVKRSAANSAGTAAAATKVPHDSLSAAATATVLNYTANPTTGSAVGTVRSAKAFIPASGTTPTNTPVVAWDFGDYSGQGIVLRGTAQSLCVNLNGTTITGNSFTINTEWTEE